MKKEKKEKKSKLTFTQRAVMKSLNPIVSQLLLTTYEIYKNHCDIFTYEDYEKRVYDLLKGDYYL